MINRRQPTPFHFQKSRAFLVFVPLVVSKEPVSQKYCLQKATVIAVFGLSIMSQKPPPLLYNHDTVRILDTCDLNSIAPPQKTYQQFQQFQGQTYQAYLHCYDIFPLFSGIFCNLEYERKYVHTQMINNSQKLLDRSIGQIPKCILFSSRIFRHFFFGAFCPLSFVLKFLLYFTLSSSLLLLPCVDVSNSASVSLF